MNKILWLFLYFALLTLGRIQCHSINVDDDGNVNIEYREKR